MKERAPAPEQTANDCYETEVDPIGEGAALEARQRQSIQLIKAGCLVRVEGARAADSLQDSHAALLRLHTGSGLAP
jgi:hypothetical protein